MVSGGNNRLAAQQPEAFDNPSHRLLPPSPHGLGGLPRLPGMSGFPKMPNLSEWLSPTSPLRQLGNSVPDANNFGPSIQPDAPTSGDKTSVDMTSVDKSTGFTEPAESAGPPVLETPRGIPRPVGREFQRRASGANDALRGSGAAEVGNATGSNVWSQLGAWVGDRSNRGARPATPSAGPRPTGNPTSSPADDGSPTTNAPTNRSMWDWLQPQQSTGQNGQNRPNARGNGLLPGSEIPGAELPDNGMRDSGLRDFNLTGSDAMEQARRAQQLLEQLRQNGVMPQGTGNDPSMRSPLSDPQFEGSSQVEMKELIEQLNQIAKTLPSDFNLNGLPIPSDGSFLPERLQDWAPKGDGNRTKGSRRATKDSRGSQGEDTDSPDESRGRNWSDITPQGFDRIVKEQLRRKLENNPSGSSGLNGDWTKQVFESVFKAAAAHSDEIVRDLQKPENQQRFGKWMQRGREINNWLVKQKVSMRHQIARNSPDVTLPNRPNWGGGWGGSSMPSMSWDMTGFWTLAILVAIGAALAAAVVWGRRQLASGRSLLPTWISIPPIEDRQTLIAAVHGTARRQFGPSAEYWTIQRLAAAATTGHSESGGEPDHRTDHRTDTGSARPEPTATALTQRLLDLYNFSRYARPELKLSEAQLAEARSALDHLQRPATQRDNTADGGWWSRRDGGSADG